MTTYTINVADPHPSTVLDGATDYDVHIAVAQGGGVRFVTGHVTMYPDRINGGALRPSGDSLDCWISKDVLRIVESLQGSDRREAIGALEFLGTTEIVVDDEVRS